MKILKRKGFTLVEIMIVVAIIALLAAIAIPNLLRARLNANEGAAIGNMHTLVTAMGSYQANQSPATYPSALENLGNASPEYIDDYLAGVTGEPAANKAKKQGYYFTYTPEAAVGGVIYGYKVSASPVQAGKTGNRWFIADGTGVVRNDKDKDGNIDATDPPIE